MRCGYKGLVFCWNNGWIMNNGKHWQRTHSTKMGADCLAENTPNASKNFSPKCLPKPPKNVAFKLMPKQDFYEILRLSIQSKTI